MILARLASRLAALTAVRLDALIERRTQQYRADLADEALRLALARVAADYGKRLEAVETHLQAAHRQPDKSTAALKMVIAETLSDVRNIRHHMQGTASDAARGK